MKFKKIYIEITNVCNLRCAFCPETHRKKEFIDVENFEKIIKKIHNYTNIVCLHVKGEPLLHNQLKEILNILDKYNLRTNITTNGILIKDKIDVLNEGKAIRQINFSIHSILQNKNRNVDYLINIFESVDKLKNVIISYRIWSKETFNNQTLDDIIKIFEKYYNITDVKANLEKHKFVKIKEKIFINQDEEFVWPNVNNQNIIEKGRCLAIKEQIAILVDGTVVPCCLDNEGDVPIGNIYEDTIEEILNKDITKKIKNNFEKGIITCKLCKTCGFLKRLENKRK